MSDAERMTLQEAADQLGVHYMTAYRYVRTGRLVAERSGVQWMVDPAEVARLRSGTPAAPRRGRVRAEGPAKLGARLVAGDEPGAWAVVEAALASGVEPADVHLDILVPALRSVGDAWEAGTLSVGDEHRATVVAQRLVGRLGPRFARRGRKRGTVVLGAPSGEQHGLPCAIVADLIRGAGFEAVDLGANTPAESFAGAALAAQRLVAVLVGTTTPERLRAARTTVSALRAGGVTAPVLVGGAAVTDAEHARRLGADGWTGPDGRSALAAVVDIAGEGSRARA